MVNLSQRAHGAHCHTLPAESTFGIRQILMEGRGNRRDKSPVHSSQRADGLHLVAHHLAAAAVDTLAHVAHDGRRRLDGEHIARSGKRYLMNLQRSCQILQFAVARLGADEAVMRVVGEDKLQHRAAGIQHAQGARVHFHALLAAGSAGGSQVAASLHLHHTHAAGCRQVGDAHVFQVHIAKRGNVYPDLPGCFQDGGAFLHLHGVVVYL